MTVHCFSTRMHWEGLLGLCCLQWQKRAQGGHIAPPMLQEPSWEAHLGLVLWGSLGKSTVEPNN